MHVKRHLWISQIFLLALVLFATQLSAHPEDEWCDSEESNLDPALCEALSELDSSTATPERLEAILDDEGNERGFWSTAVLYVSIGVRHILPAGLDHILFVLALFLSSTRPRALVVQVSTFTIAHTVTLGLAAAGVLSPPTSVVEPLIAATIAFVAIENLYLQDMPRWRPIMVFIFGLVHGLGFAGFFGELGLPPGQFWSALIGFNIGVEIGQLGVIVVAFVASYMLRRRLARLGREFIYRRVVVIPMSALIGAIGAYWMVTRILIQLA